MSTTGRSIAETADAIYGALVTPLTFRGPAYFWLAELQLVAMPDNAWNDDHPALRGLQPIDLDEIEIGTECHGIVTQREKAR